MTIPYKQPSFDTGEISPQVLSRTDLQKRMTALGICKNFITLAHGPAERRPGLEYITALRDSTEKGRLVPFEFSVDDAYMIVMNDNHFRFYRDGAEIAAGGGGTYEEGHIFHEAYLEDVDTAQSADTLFLAHTEVSQKKLVRSDHNDWNITNVYVSNFHEQPLLDMNITSVTLILSAKTGSGVTLTASSALFVADDVGRIVGIMRTDGATDWVTATAYTAGHLRKDTDVTYRCILAHTSSGATQPGTGDNWSTYWVVEESAWCICYISAFTSTTVVTVTVLTECDHLLATTRWALGAWSDTTGYPRTVTFANDRLCWAGSPTYPHYLWLSRVSEYYSFVKDDPLTAASALTLVLSAGKLNAVKWLRFPRRLTCGTGGAEWWMTDVSGDGPITAESKHASPASGHGCEGVNPVEMGNILVFLQKHGRVVRELFYEYENDSFGGEELTVLAEHLTRDYGIIRMAFQRTPYRVLWCVRSDGKLLGCTYYREHKITGWHIHETDGLFEDVAVIPGDAQDEVWFIIKRTIDGSDVRHIERFASQFSGTDTTDATLLDSYLTLDGRQEITSINESTDVVTLTSHGYSNGDTVRFRVEDDPDAEEGDSGSLNLQEATISDKTTHTFKCKDDDAAYFDFSKYTDLLDTGTHTVAKNVTAISGLSHLEGKAVDVVADGVALAQHTVASGAITLDDSASVVHVGLNYVSNLQTLTPDLQLKSGSSMSVQKRVVEAVIQLYRTLGMQVGTDEDNLIDQQFSDDTVLSGQPADLFTGQWPVTFEDPDDTEATVYVRQSLPLPITVLAIESQIEIDGGDD